jgi:hypothetical protein
MRHAKMNESRAAARHAACVLLGLAACGRTGGAPAVDASHPPEPAACTENGVAYPSGSSWTCSDGCNACSCDRGKVVASLRGCPPQIADSGPGYETTWADGASCMPGSFHWFNTTTDGGECMNLCDCQPSLHLLCLTDCAPAATSPLPGCEQGASCQWAGCSNRAVGPTGCAIGCVCDEGAGTYRCSDACPNLCGLPEAITCSICADGEVHCLHYVLVDGLCLLEECPENGILRGL